MKIFKKLLIIMVTIVAILSPLSFADDMDFKAQIKQEDGSLFEKIIAECIGGIAQTVFNFTTGESANVGFKDYDTLIFNNNEENDALSPFTTELWNKAMNYYHIFAIISGSLILIAVFILSYKIMMAGMSTSKKNDAKDSLMRLLFGGAFIMLAPLFIRFLLFINNSFVHLLVTLSAGNLENLLGNGMLSSIKTGNAITTALVIAMFIYLFVKLNIKFIIRQFTIIIFTIFTPFATGLWIINKNVTAASIWAGQIIMNIFMQFIYSFLFIIYIAFLPSGGGWAVSLIWAMMILPLADALQNSFQNLTSRIAGLDNEQMTGRAMGMGAAIGYSISAFKEQFKTPSSKSDNNSNGGNGFSGFVNRAKAVINPSMNLSDEKDYNGNVNPIRNIINTKFENSNNSNSNNNFATPQKKDTENSFSKRDIAMNVLKTGFNAGKAYLNIGKSMAEGDFNVNSYHTKVNNPTKNKNTMQDTEYLNNLSKINPTQKSGDNIENSKNSFKE